MISDINSITDSALLGSTSDQSQGCESKGPWNFSCWFKPVAFMEKPLLDEFQISTAFLLDVKATIYRSLFFCICLIVLMSLGQLHVLAMINLSPFSQPSTGVSAYVLETARDPGPDPP